MAVLSPEQHLADARDHALLLIGWKAALRTDDLARLHLSDLHSSEQGLSVHLARSKTDQTGHGTTLGIAAPPGSETTTSTRWGSGRCWMPVRSGPAGATGSAPTASSTARHGAGIDRYGRLPRATGLHRNAIAEIIKRRAGQARLDDAPLWGGHSLRRGFATEATAAGVPERDVQRHGRWRSRASVDLYIDAVTTFDATNPTRWLT